MIRWIAGAILFVFLLAIVLGGVGIARLINQAQEAVTESRETISQLAAQATATEVAEDLEARRTAAQQPTQPQTDPVVVALATQVALLQSAAPEVIVVTATPLPATATPVPDPTSFVEAGIEASEELAEMEMERAAGREGIILNAAVPPPTYIGAIPRDVQDSAPNDEPGIIPDNAREIGMEGSKFWVSGGVETATNMEQAHGEFVNSLGLGTQSWLAEPGKLLVNGFDFDLGAMKGSGGAIDHWNPTNQQIFGWDAPAYWNLNEGGFALLVANRATIQVPDRAQFHFEGDDTTAWIVIFRGLYSDFSSPADRNLNLVVTDYVPGNIMAARYSGTPNGGFVSEGQFHQIAETTQGTWNNCGQSGCPKLFALFYDANTGGWLVLERATPDGAWSIVSTNMDYLY